MSTVLQDFLEHPSILMYQKPSKLTVLEDDYPISWGWRSDLRFQHPGEAL